MIRLSAYLSGGGCVLGGVCGATNGGPQEIVGVYEVGGYFVILCSSESERDREEREWEGERERGGRLIGGCGHTYTSFSLCFFLTIDLNILLTLGCWSLSFLAGCPSPHLQQQ